MLVREGIGKDGQKWWCRGFSQEEKEGRIEGKKKMQVSSKGNVKGRTYALELHR